MVAGNPGNDKMNNQVPGWESQWERVFHSLMAGWIDCKWEKESYTLVVVVVVVVGDAVVVVVVVSAGDVDDSAAADMADYSRVNMMLMEKVMMVTEVVVRHRHMLALQIYQCATRCLQEAKLPQVEQTPSLED